MTLATGQTAVGILKALGFEDKHVTTLSIHFAAEELVTIKVEFNLTEEQVKGLEGEVATIAKTYHLIEIDPDEEKEKATEAAKAEYVKLLNDEMEP